MTYGFEIKPVNRRVARSNLVREPIFSQFFKCFKRPSFLESLEHLERATVDVNRIPPITSVERLQDVDELAEWRTVPGNR